MPEEPATPPPPPPPLPRPVIPINPAEEELLAPPSPHQQQPPPAEPIPVMPVAEPGVPPTVPFAGVYTPPPLPTAAPHPYAQTPPPPQAPPGYYPPTYPPPAYSYSPIDYRNQAAMTGRGRPGIVTAMGVMAIIVAVLSFAGSLFSGCTGLVTMTNARRAAMAVRTTTAPTPLTTTAMPATPGVGNQPAGPDGLSPADRQVVIKALKSRLRVYLTPEREQQIDAFLARHGKAVLSDPDDALTNRKVFDHLAEVGQEYSTPGTTPPAYFVFKSGTICKMPGRLRVMDDRWVYEPSDGSPTLRSPAPPTKNNATASATPDSTPSPPATAPLPDGVEDDEARAIINRVRTLSNNRLNSAQSAALSSLLQSPTAGAYLTPSGTIPGYTAQVRSAAVRSDGTIQIAFNMGQLTLDRQGNPVGPLATPAPGTASNNPAGGGPNFVYASVPISRGSGTTVMIDAGLGVLLAIFLLVIGILSLRQTPGTRRLFVIYAVVKIACGVAAIIAFSSIISALNAAANSTGPNTIPIILPWFTGISTSAMVFTIIGLTFPVAVLLTLTLSKSAREYYRTTG